MPTQQPNNLEAVHQHLEAAKIKLRSRLLREKAAKARKSLADFLEFVIKDQETGKNIVLDDIHREWCFHMDRYWEQRYHIGVLAPWGHGKSQIVPIGNTLYRIGKNPDERICIICNTDSNASKRLGMVKSYIDDSEEFHDVFPNVKPDPAGPWSEHKLKVKRTVIATEPTLESMGIDSSGISSRYSIMIYDDPIDEKDAASETVRKSRIERFRNVWSSRLIPKGKNLYIATRWHQEDLTGQLLRNSRWRFIVQGVSADFDCIEQPPDSYRGFLAVEDKAQPKKVNLWTHWPQELLKEQCETISLRAFNRGYRQIPFSEEDTLFELAAVERLQERGWAISRTALLKDCTFKITGVDLSNDKRPGTAMVTLGRAKDGRRIILDVRRGNWGWGTKCASIVHGLYGDLNPRMIFVEDNTAQEALLGWMKQSYGQDFPVKGFTTGSNKLEEEVGLPSLSILIEQDAFVMPLRHIIDHKDRAGSCKCGYCTLIKELKEYPHGATSDVMMALWIANEGMNKYLRRAKAPTGGYSGSRQQYRMGGQARIFSTDSKRIFG